MAFGERTVLAGTMTVALWLAAEPAWAQDERLLMRIVVYDRAQVPPDVLAQARTVVSRVFGEIGVDAGMDGGCRVRARDAGRESGATGVRPFRRINQHDRAGHAQDAGPQEQRPRGNRIADT